MACPSSSQCTAVDGDGSEVTFDPSDPSTPPGVAVYTSALEQVACPSVTQCTAIGVDSTGVGREVTFNPESPGTPPPEPMGFVPSGIACPSTHQCTVVSKNGTEASFDPADPAGGTSYPINSQVLVAIACPTTNQCSALDGGDTAVTFDPTSRGSSRHDTINDPQDSLVAIACPSVSECVAIGTDGDAFVGTFAAARLKAPSTARLATRITVTASGLNPGRYSLALYVVAIASAHPTVCTGRIGPTTKASSGQLEISGFLPTRLPCHSGAGPIVGYFTVRPGTYELILGGAAGAQRGTSGITRTIHLTR